MKTKQKKIKDVNILKWTTFEVLMVVTIQKLHTRVLLHYDTLYL